MRDVGTNQCSYHIGVSEEGASFINTHSKDRRKGLDAARRQLQPTRVSADSGYPTTIGEPWFATALNERNFNQ